MRKVMCRYLPDTLKAVRVPEGMWRYGVNPESLNERRLRKEMWIYTLLRLPNSPKRMPYYILIICSGQKYFPSDPSWSGYSIMVIKKVAHWMKQFLIWRINFKTSNKNHICCYWTMQKKSHLCIRLKVGKVFRVIRL